MDIKNSETNESKDFMGFRDRFIDRRNCRRNNLWSREMKVGKMDFEVEKKVRLT